MKILITFAITCLYLIIAFPVSVISYLSMEIFYYRLVFASLIVLYLFIVFKIYFRTSKKVTSITIFSILLVFSLIIGSFELHKYYYQSSVKVVDTEVDLEEYAPFAVDSKVVKLDQPSSLTLKAPLPKLDGATALYPVYSAFVRSTYPIESYDSKDVGCTKTGTAYTRLISGEVDIIFAAAPSKKQLEEAEEKGVILTLTPIGREAFVFFVNSRNKVTNLSIEEIQNIYSGQIDNWKEVGGRNEAIRAFQRPENSGSQTALQGFMGEKELMTAPTEDIIRGMGGIISETANYQNHRNAIGYSFRYYSTEMVQNGAIKHLKINGVFPDKETIRSGEYPLSSEFYVITAGSDNPNIDAFIDWILSEQGQFIIEETGYVSLY